MAQIPPGSLVRITEKSMVNPPVHHLVVILENHPEHNRHASPDYVYCSILLQNGSVMKMWVELNEVEVISEAG